jgi:hypothetical protein
MQTYRTTCFAPQKQKAVFNQSFHADFLFISFLFNLSGYGVLNNKKKKKKTKKKKSAFIEQ